MNCELYIDAQFYKANALSTISIIQALTPGLSPHDVCPRCNHFSTCRDPCYPVAEYLKADNLSVFERSHTDPETGQTTTLVFYRSREVVESDLPQDDVLLSEASIPTRYPESLSQVQKEFTESIVKEILARGKEVIEWIKKQF